MGFSTLRRGCASALCATWEGIRRQAQAQLRPSASPPQAVCVPSGSAGPQQSRGLAPASALFTRRGFCVLLAHSPATTPANVLKASGGRCED